MTAPSQTYTLTLSTTDILYDYSDTRVLHTITAPVHAANTLARSALRDELEQLGPYPHEEIEERLTRSGEIILSTSGGPNTSLDFELRVARVLPTPPPTPRERVPLYTVVLMSAEGAEMLGVFREEAEANVVARGALRKAVGVKGWQERRVLKTGYRETEAEGGFVGEWKGEGDAWRDGSGKARGPGWVRCIVQRGLLV